MSATLPMYVGCSQGSGKPLSNKSNTSLTPTGPKAIRPRSESISTRGSSQNAPREPLRTISTCKPLCFECRAILAATSSAPKAQAVVSDGMKTFIMLRPLSTSGQNGLHQHGQTHYRQFG